MKTLKLLVGVAAVMFAAITSNGQGHVEIHNQSGYTWTSASLYVPGVDVIEPVTVRTKNGEQYVSINNDLLPTDGWQIWFEVSAVSGDSWTSQVQFPAPSVVSVYSVPITPSVIENLFWQYDAEEMANFIQPVPEPSTNAVFFCMGLTLLVLSHRAEKASWWHLRGLSQPSLRSSCIAGSAKP